MYCRFDLDLAAQLSASITVSITIGTTASIDVDCAIVRLAYHELSDVSGLEAAGCSCRPAVAFVFFV